MAKLEIKFELNDFPFNLIMGEENTSAATLLNKAQSVTELITRIGGKAPGQPDTDHRCKASYLKCDEGEGKYVGKVFYKVYGAVGSWIAGYGVPIYPEVLTAYGFNPQDIAPGQKIPLDGYDVIFSVKLKDGKEQPHKVMSLIKTNGGDND